MTPRSKKRQISHIKNNWDKEDDGGDGDGDNPNKK